MKRIMGIDYGDARTGIAVSDLLCSIVGTTKVIHSRNMEKTVAAVCDLLKGSDVGEIVVGLPKNMDGTEGARAELCKAFAEKLKEVKLTGKSSACFLIGSSFGIAPQIKELADFKLSMGPMTFPHHLARIMVLEQLYRAEAIQAGSNYHK